MKYYVAGMRPETVQTRVQRVDEIKAKFDESKLLDEDTDLIQSIISAGAKIFPLYSFMDQPLGTITQFGTRHRETYNEDSGQIVEALVRKPVVRLTKFGEFVFKLLYPDRKDIFDDGLSE